MMKDEMAGIIVKSLIMTLCSFISNTYNLGVREARDSPSTPPSHNPAFKIDSNHDSDDLGI